MLKTKRRYVVDEQDRQVTVQIDVETFARIEEVLEDFAMTLWTTDTQEEEALGFEAARAYYESLDKATAGRGHVGSRTMRRIRSGEAKHPCVEP